MPSSKQPGVIKLLKPNRFFERPSARRVLRNIVLPSLLGLIAGLVGAMVGLGFGGAFISQGSGLMPGLLNSGSEKSIDAPPDYEATDRLTDSVVAVYKSGADKGGIVPQENFLASGLALTSDGWVVSLKSLSASAIKTGVVWGRHFYSIEKTMEDDLTGLVFLKIKVRGLPLAPFGKSNALKNGDELMAIDASRAISLARVLNTRLAAFGSNVHSSEMLDVFVQTEDVPSSTPIFSRSGEFVGLSKGNGKMIPAHFIERALRKLLKDNKISQTSLGVYYQDLSQSVFMGESQSGALLKSTKDKTAVSKNGPAAKAGLKEGDIIKTVDNIELNQNQSLAEVIASYTPGQKVELTIERDGVEKKVEVTLGELK